MGGRRIEVLGMQDGYLYLQNRKDIGMNVSKVVIRDYECDNIEQLGSIGLIQVNIFDCINRSGILLDREPGTDIWEDVYIETTNNYMRDKNIYLATTNRERHRIEPGTLPYEIDEDSNNLKRNVKSYNITRRFSGSYYYHNGTTYLSLDSDNLITLTINSTNCRSGTSSFVIQHSKFYKLLCF